MECLILSITFYHLCGYKVMSGSHTSPGSLLNDICDGTIWNDDEPTLQIVAYYDDFVLTNPLMSRSKKYKIGRYTIIHICHNYTNNGVFTIGAIYFMLVNLDPALRSRLESIHLIALFESKLLVNYSIDDILRPFINDLKEFNAVRNCMKLLIIIK